MSEHSEAEALSSSSSSIEFIGTPLNLEEPGGVGWKASSSAIPSLTSSAERSVKMGSRSRGGASGEEEAAQLKQRLEEAEARNAALLEACSKMKERDRKSKAVRSKLASRLKTLLQSESNAVPVIDAQDIVRAWEQSLLLVSHHVADVAEAERRALHNARQVEYYQAKYKQIDAVARCAILLIKESGDEALQTALAHGIRKARQQHEVPELPPAEAPEMDAEALASASPKYAALVRKQRDLTRFIAARKDAILESARQQQEATAAAVAQANDNGAGDAASNVAKRNSMTLGRASGPVQVLHTERQLPENFPLHDYLSVGEVQKVLSKLERRHLAASGADGVDAKREAAGDAVKAEACKAEPDVDWIVKQLLVKNHSYDLSPTWRNRRKQSLLHLVVSHKHSGKLVETLLTKHDFDPFVTDIYGLNALHTACISQSSNAAAALLKRCKKKKQLANTVWEDLITPLHLAALFNDVPTLKVLLSHGANAAPTDINAATPLIYSVLNDAMDASTYLATKVVGIADMADDDGNTPSTFAALYSKGEMLDVLLNAKADCNTPNVLGVSPLWATVQQNDLECYSLLLQALHDSQALRIEQPLGLYKNTIIMKALLFLSPRKLNVFLPPIMDAAANVDARNAERKTALFFAVAMDRPDTVRQLLQFGADPNAKDINLNTPLHFARSSDTASILLQHGSKISTPNKQGNTPLHTAYAFQAQEVVKLLLTVGAADSVENKAGEAPADCIKYHKSRLVFPFYHTDKSCEETGGILLQ